MAQSHLCWLVKRLNSHLLPCRVTVPQRISSHEKYNAAPQVLIPVFKEASDPIPTKENDLINALENNSHNFDMSCTIDTLKRNIIDHDDNLESESI